MSHFSLYRASSRCSVLLACLLLNVNMVSAQNLPKFDGKSWWEYVKVLADDNMEGRETGSPGYQKAQLSLSSNSRRMASPPPAARATTSPSSLSAARLTSPAPAWSFCGTTRHRP